MIRQLFQAFAALPQVEAIALGGSRAGVNFDEKSDYDVYLYCTGPIEESVRRELLERFCGYMELGNHFWELEDNCTLKNGVDIDILYRNIGDFTAQVASVVEDFQPYNGYTTCMWHNLLTCRIIYDQTGRLAAAKARFNIPYPAQLRENIIARNMKLLTGTLPAYDGQIRKAAARGDQVSICHRTAAFMEAYFDIIWALNGLTHPGEKRLVALARERCPLLPEDFERNIEILYSHLFTAPAEIPGDLERIVTALRKIL